MLAFIELNLDNLVKYLWYRNSISYGSDITFILKSVIVIELFVSQWKLASDACNNFLQYSFIR